MISKLVVYHYSKVSGAAEERLQWVDIPDSFWKIETCQRELAIGFAPLSGALRGLKAYELLLRISAGLESEIKGETDVFGQIKNSWNLASLTLKSQESFEALVLKLFADTKDIRTRFLQSVGGDSYGRLVRAFLKQKAKPESKLLLVGAGKLAKSVAPWLTDYPLWISNRTVSSAYDLKNEIESKREHRSVVPGMQKCSISVVQSFEDELALLPQLDWIILGVPVSETDEARIRALLPHTQVLHLGAIQSHLGIWNRLGTQVVALDALFRLQDKGDQNAVELAIKACHEKAQLRALGGTTSLPHGWEDLAFFELPVHS